MSHFYGVLQGNKGEATRCGTKSSGMQTYCASWKGAVRCFAYVNEHNIDCVRVELVKWHGEGSERILYDGPIAGEAENIIFIPAKGGF